MKDLLFEVMILGAIAETIETRNLTGGNTCVRYVGNSLTTPDKDYAMNGSHTWTLGIILVKSAVKNFIRLSN